MRKLFRKTALVVLICIWSGPLYSQTPSWQWVNGVGGMYYEIPTSMTTDPFGGIYLTGFFNDSLVIFGNDTLINSGNFSDIFIVKYDANGNTIWSKKAGGNDDEEVQSIVADPDGNIYIAGVFNSISINLDSITLYHSGVANTGIDFFIAKYDSSGHILWARNFGNSGNEKVWALAFDPGLNGGVYATGEFDSDSLQLDNIKLFNNSTIKMFLARFDTNGNPIWATSAEGNGGARPQSMSVGDSNSIYISGDFFNYEVIFGPDTLSTAGLEDIFLVKYNNYGIPQWARSGTGPGADNGLAIKAENKFNGNVYVSGGFTSDTLTFDTIHLTGTLRDIYIVKYDTNGKLLRAKNEGGQQDESVTALALDPAGNLYTAGSFTSGSITFGSTIIYNSNSATSDFFIVKYDSSGIVIWAKKVGGSGLDNVTALVVDSLYNIYASGYFESNPLVFDSITLNNTGYFDMFVGKSGIPSSVGIIETTFLPDEMVLFPNPSGGILNIKNYDNATLYEVYDVSGQKISAGKLNSIKHAIDLSAQPSGLYCIIFKNESRMVMKKIVKL